MPIANQSGECTIAEYIVLRLRALDVRHIYQVPGNYTSDFLRAAQNSGDIQCVNTTNEMEAGYAADAYARLKKIGVICVTYGVGSFSAFNAIAGSFVEFCPVLMINGVARKDKTDQFVRQGVLFAHAIDQQRTDEFFFRGLTVATAVITGGENAPAEIDRVLRTMLSKGRPGYIEVPDGVWNQFCALPTDADKPLQAYPPSPSEEKDQTIAVAAAARMVAERIRDAKRPVLWGGEFLQRLGLENSFHDLVTLTQLPYTTTLMGKGLISENTPGFIGVYDSVFAPKDVREVVEGADLLIGLGTILVDFYGQVVARKWENLILAAGDAVRLGPTLVPNVPLARFLPALIEELKNTERSKSQHEPPLGFQALVQKRSPVKSAPQVAAATGAAPQPVTWDSLFARLRNFMKPEFLVIPDTSMALFPAAELPILREGHFIAQTCWLSIGYTGGAALGASHAQPSARVLAIAGDGGFQMVPQALSTLVRFKVPAIVVVCDNRLYAVEQFLIDNSYFQNDADPIFFNVLPDWDYEALAKAFGAWGREVKTIAELDEALTEASTLKDRPALIVVRLAEKDLPSELRPSGPHATAAAVAAIAGPQIPPVVNLAAFN